MSFDRNILKEYLQSGSVAVTSSGVNVTIAPPITTYIITFRCVDSNNIGVSVDFTNVAANGFTATSDRDGTLHWVALRAGGY